MAAPPAQQVLSEAFQSAIGGRRVKAAVFLTFQLDPAFFEQHVLPLLFDRTFGAGAVRLAQLEDELRSLPLLAVYYDRRGLVPNGSARLDYRRFGLARPGGVFHAKNALVLVENEEDRRGEVVRYESLVLLTTSANLTRPGWFENVEIADVTEIRPGERTLIRDDLLGKGGLISRVIEHDATKGDHAALDAIRAFLLSAAGSAENRSAGGIYRTRFFVGNQSLPEFLQDEIGVRPDTFNLEVLAPFVEDSKDAATLAALVEAVSPWAVRVMLPRTREGAVACSRAYYEAVASLRRVTWAEMPDALTAWSDRKRDAGARFVHAKAYRLFSPETGQNLLLVGSPNLTEAAHSPARRGNFESAIFVDATDDGAPSWWLRAEGDGTRVFRPEPPPEAEAQSLADFGFALAYDWQRHSLRYFWESGPGVPPAAEVRYESSSLFRIDQVHAGRWVDLPDAAATAVRERLLATSIVTLVVGDRQQKVLVMEEGMARKPSLVEDLTPEQILEYWSLLSPEQKDAFLERVLEARRELLGAQDGARPLDDAGPRSMFDRFAGIFHAFSCMEEELRKALNEGRTRDVDYLQSRSSWHAPTANTLTRTKAKRNREVGIRWLSGVQKGKAKTTLFGAIATDGDGGSSEADAQRKATPATRAAVPPPRSPAPTVFLSSTQSIVDTPAAMATGPAIVRARPRR